MSKRYLTDIDLMGFALLQARLHPVTTDPSGLGSTDGGRLWFNDTGKTFKFWTGTGIVDLRDRSTMTGTQLASTISDFASAVQALRWQSMLAPNSPVNMGSQRLTSVADPTSATDGATKGYVDSALAGLSSGQQLKGAVRVAATGNVSLSSPGATIDGVTLTSGDIVLLTGQTNAAQNGPYLWTGASTALTRAANWDTSAEAALGSYWIVMQGAQADTFALLTNDTPVTLDTTNLAFVFRGAAGATYTGGAGLILSGTEFNVGAGNGILVDADAVRVDPAVVVRKVTGIIPASSSGIVSVSGGNVTINHGLNNPRPLLGVKYGSAGAVPNAPVEVDETYPDANNVVIALPQAPVANQFVFTVEG